MIKKSLCYITQNGKENYLCLGAHNFIPQDKKDSYRLFYSLFIVEYDFCFLPHML